MAPRRVSSAKVIEHQKKLQEHTSKTKYEVKAQTLRESRELVNVSQTLRSRDFVYVSRYAAQSELPAWTSSPYYGCASFDVTNKATTIEWKGYGLKIQILDDSIPQYLTMARLGVSVHYFNNQEYLYRYHVVPMILLILSVPSTP